MGQATHAPRLPRVPAGKTHMRTDGRGPTVLGVYLGHDPGCCLMCDGRIECAIEQERLTRCKHGRPRSLGGLWGWFGWSIVLSSRRHRGGLAFPIAADLSIGVGFRSHRWHASLGGLVSAAAAFAMVALLVPAVKGVPHRRDQSGGGADIDVTRVSRNCFRIFPSEIESDELRG
jgi:hypothetical protein